MRRLLAMLQHADSTFPSGSFAFSNGIEGLAALGTPLDGRMLQASLTAIIRHRWAPADRVALTLAHRAGTDLPAVGAIDAMLEAATLVEPTRLGSRRNGQALLAAHLRLATPGAAELSSAIAAGQSLGHLPVVQGFLWRAVGFTEEDAVAISGYTTAAGLVAAAVRLGAIGAIEAQAVLASGLAVVAEEIAAPVGDAQPIASFVPLIDIAAARHVRAPVRLFAS
jgi:urease accessory protein